MKRLIRILLKVVFIFFLTLFILLLILPLFFKNEITHRAERELNERLNARVELTDLGLSFFTSFPNLTINLKGLNLIGTGHFDNDTLLKLSSFKLAINPFSLLGKSGPRVTSLVINKPELHVTVLESGLASYDIIKEAAVEGQSAEEESDTTSQEWILNLRKFRIMDARIHYHDRSAGMVVVMDQFQCSLRGKLGLSETILDLNAEAARLVLEMGGIRYLNNINFTFSAGIDADLDQMKFAFRNNQLRMNALLLEFEGGLDLSEENPVINLNMVSRNNDFKSLISLIPSIYSKEFEALETSGSISLEGQVQGVYSSSDSLYPDFDIRIEVEDAMFKYPALPASVDDVNFLVYIQKKGATLDQSMFDLQRFSMRIANQSLEAAMLLHHPISDPSIKAWVKTDMDLSALGQALPMDSTQLQGDLKINVNFEGQLSSIQMGQYDHFQASGSASLMAFELLHPEIPLRVTIPQAKLDVSPRMLNLSKLDMILGESDFQIEGNLQNYLAYMLKQEIMVGELSLRSSLCDLNTLMPMSGSSDEEETVHDSLPPIKIPRNIDFRFASQLREIRYTNMVLKEVNGLILIQDGKLILDGLDMNVLDGKVFASGTYDTSDTLNPFMTMILTVDHVDIPAAFHTFNMVQALAPFARDLRGKVSATLNYSGLIGADFKPVVSSMFGSGSLQSEEVQVLNSKSFDQFKTLFKMNEQLTNTFQDLDLSFGMANGRLIVDPFDIRLANTMVNVSGDHGLDQTLNYLLKTNIPRASLGAGVNQLADEVLTQAASLGLNFDPGDQIPVHVKISGKIGEPQLSPSIGSGSSTSIKEVVVQEVREEIKEQTERLEQEVRQDVSEEVTRILEQAEKEAENVRKIAGETADQLKKEGYAAADKVETEARGKGMIAENIAKRAADKLRQEADRQSENIIREADDKAILILEAAKEKARILEEGKK